MGRKDKIVHLIEASAGEVHLAVFELPAKQNCIEQVVYNLCDILDPHSRNVLASFRVVRERAWGCLCLRASLAWNIPRLIELRLEEYIAFELVSAADH